MNFSFKIVLVLALLVIRTCVAFSQYNKIEKVNTNSYFIYDISQDLYNRLIVSTENGLTINDGKNKINISKKNGLCSSICTSHLVDKQNNIWVGHYEGGISLIKKNKINKILFKVLEDKPIVKIVQVQHKFIYILTQDQLLFQLIRNDKNKYEIQKINSRINDICEVDNYLFYSTTKGIYKLDHGNPAIQTSKKISSQGANFILKTKRNELLTFSMESGITLYKNLNFNLTKSFQVKQSELDQLKEVEVSSILYNTSDKTVYLSAKVGGIFTFSLANKQVTSINDKINLNSEKSIKKIFLDHQQAIWIGTFGEDLMRVSNSNLIEFRTAKPINTICAFNSENLLLGTNNGILNFNKATGKTFEFDELKKLSALKISCLQKIQNFIWIGTENDGIFQYDLKKKQLYDFSKLKSLKFKNITCITENKSNNTILFGTLEGVYIYDKKKRIVENLNTDNGLPHNVVKTLFVDTKGTIWFGFNGLTLCNLVNSEITVFKNIESLKSNEINCINEDKNGVLWFGSEGDGLFYYQKGKFKQITSEKGLLSDYIKFIDFSGDGQNVAGSKTGITLLKDLNGGRFLITNYKNKSCGDNSLLKINNKEMYIGTNKSLINLSFNKSNNNNSNAFISHLSINNKNYFPEKSISLPYKEYNVKFEFVKVTFNKNEKTNYKFKLDGYDNEWQYENNLTEIKYPKLYSGEYTFIVYASNNLGEFDTNPATILILIDKPFWQKWYILALIFTLIASIVFLIFKWRVDILMKAKIRLEEEVKIKTMELQEEKELVEEKNKDIIASLNYAFRIQKAILPSHHIESPESIEKLLFYQPKDIVSGDFYWEYEHKDYHFFAVADCTGHGVPGAFMSILSNTILTKIIKENKVTSPAEILKCLDENLVVALNQFDENAPKDGLEIGILRISKDFNEVVYASAKRPLLIKLSKEHKVIKPDIYGIGSFNYGIPKTYENHTFTINENTEFFMYSDGYADQFGGELNKKISTRKLNELLFEDCDLLQIKQTKLKSYFKIWKGEFEQTDDVLVLGIKIVK